MPSIVEICRAAEPYVFGLIGIGATALVTAFVGTIVKEQYDQYCDAKAEKVCL